MIDLHLHTTASDGCDTPGELVSQLADAGIGLFAVTDHDTVAAWPAVSAAAAARGLVCLTGIEITAVEQGRDVHVLGYGFDAASAEFTVFLENQREVRQARVRAFGERFKELGLPIDVDSLAGTSRAARGHAVGRAHVARLLLAAGHVSSVEQAFDRWLSPGRPAFVERRGPTVTEVVGQLAAAGGIASLAHPLLLRDEALVGRLISSGIAALEAFHSEHDAEATARYVSLAASSNLVVSGGSDFHGASANQKRRLGGVSLPAPHYRALRSRAVSQGSAIEWPDWPQELT